MVATTRPNGIETILCVHFSTRAGEHCIGFAEAAPQCEVRRARAARLDVEWEARDGGLLRGRALLRGDVACDAFLLTGEPADPANERDVLRAEGLPREWSSLVARMPERPLLVTVARGPELSPTLLRRVHSLLIAAADVPELRPV
jgi:hypothetical protein